jgi:hypothetical protein
MCVLYIQMLYLLEHGDEPVRITIDTDSDTYEGALKTLNAAYGVANASTSDLEGDDEVDGSSNGRAGDSVVILGGWNAKKLRKWARWLRDDAAEVVRYLAAHAPEVSYDEVAAHLGAVKGLSEPVDGKVLGGAMSSGGHAANAIPGVKGQPIDRDHARRVYVIDPRVASVLAEELGRPAT